MLRVLINAYACSPGMGSEPGMAWNWCVNLAKYCELYIITEGEFQDKIETTLASLPQGGNMYFYYNPVSDRVRKMCWNQGDWRFYKYYREWQLKTADIAREICRREQIDILHQLNMIGFREPGYLWKVSQETGIPFVWGPVDAKDSFPMAYAEGAGMKVRMFLHLKNFITKCQLRYSKRVQKAVYTAEYVLAASSNSVSSFKKYLTTDALLINETGTSPQIGGIKPIPERDGKPLDILWVGKMDFRKQLGLALKSVATAGIPNLCFHIVGGGDAGPYQKEAETLGIDHSCIWHGSIGHEEVLNLMQNSDLLFFTSVAEGTPHVVLEAIGNGLPVLCFDTCGQGDSVNAKVGIKIPLTTPQQSVKDFADKITYLYEHRDVLKQMSENCAERAEELSWDNKARQVVGLYEKAVRERT